VPAGPPPFRSGLRRFVRRHSQARCCQRTRRDWADPGECACGNWNRYRIGLLGLTGLLYADNRTRSDGLDRYLRASAPRGGQAAELGQSYAPIILLARRFPGRFVDVRGRRGVGVAEPAFDRVDVHTASQELGSVSLVGPTWRPKGGSHRRLEPCAGHQASTHAAAAKGRLVAAKGEAAAGPRRSTTSSG
jgi:hypothetical protein